MIIGFVGFAGSGKDTCANILTEYGYNRESFAKPLKDAVASTFNWDRELLEGLTKESRIWREQVDEWWSQKLRIPDFTPRKALVLWGTEVIRDGFHDDTWILSLLNRVKDQNKVVITDVRFPNEIKMIHSIGGKIIRVKRGPDPKWVNDFLNADNGDAFLKTVSIHRSEAVWLKGDIDYTIENNTTIEDLSRQLRSLTNYEPSRG